MGQNKRPEPISRGVNQLHSLPSAQLKMSSTRSSSGNAAANFTDEQIKSLKQAFLLCTTPECGDGVIPAKALGEALQSLGHNPKSEEMDAFWNKKRDENHQASIQEKIETIDFTEFLVILNKRRQDALTNRDELREAIQKFDIGNKNCLTADELRYCLTATGDHPLSEEEFREVLSRAQFDEHGKLHFPQFAQL